MRYFIVVAEELNLTRAAERLFIAQPPLSRQIKQLEEELEVALFIRKPRGLELTAAGQYFLAKSHEVIDKLDRVVGDTRRIAQQKKKVFSIGFVPSVFIDELPLMVRRLRNHSGVEVMLHDLKTLEQIEALKSGKIDIGFGRLFFDDPEIVQRQLYTESLLAALPASETSNRNKLGLSTLASMPLIIYPKTTGPNFSDIILAQFERCGLKATIIQQVNDVQTALALVASGMGYALVPQRWAKAHSQGVEYRELSDEAINIPVVVSRRKDDGPSEAMSLVEKILAEKFS